MFGRLVGGGGGDEAEIKKINEEPKFIKDPKTNKAAKEGRGGEARPDRMSCGEIKFSK